MLAGQYYANPLYRERKKGRKMKERYNFSKQSFFSPAFKTPNKQIFMITDGKPTCLKEANGYYKNSFGLDRKVVNKTLNLAAAARRVKIPITTFMITSDPYLQKFVEEFTEVNQGKAYYSGLKGLGHLVFEDYKKNRRKSL